MSIVIQLSVSQCPQSVNLSLVVRRGQGIERPLCLCLKDRPLVARDSQEGREGRNIFPLSAREVLLQVRFVVFRKSNGLMLREQESIFIPPGVAGSRACDVGGGIRGLFNRGLERAARCQ